MNEQDVSDLRRRLADRNLTAVADAAGISAHTIYRFMQGSHEPRRSTLILLQNYLAQN